MSREILFKGKRKDNGEWIQGFLFCVWNEVYILWGTTNGVPDMVEVIPETVCEYTGLTDKNGKKIFEGDIVRADDYVFFIQYGKCGGVQNANNYGYMGFYLEPLSEKTKYSAYYGLRNDICYFTNINVISNIYGNPGFMEGEKI